MNEQTQPGTACVSDNLIAALFNVANDHEASMLQDLLVKCGELWRCPTCAATFDWDCASCEFCGTAQPERAPLQQRATPTALAMSRPPITRKLKTVQLCPFCGAVGTHTLEEESAFVTFETDDPEADPEEDAVYTFACCNRSIALLYARPKENSEIQTQGCLQCGRVAPQEERVPSFEGLQYVGYYCTNCTPGSATQATAEEGS